MDQRTTFPDNSQLLAIISGLSDQKQQASFLIDRNGLERVEGKISAIKKHPGDVDKSLVVIDNSKEIELRQVIGLNGIFRSDYSEC